MKILEWDVVGFMEGKEQREIQTDTIAFATNDRQRYLISEDKETGAISIYKMGYDHDQILITPKGSNHILIK